MSQSWEDIKNGMLNSSSPETSSEPSSDGAKSKLPDIELLPRSRKAAIFQMVLFACLSTACFAVTFYIITNKGGSPNQAEARQSMDSTGPGMQANYQVSSSEVLGL